MGRWTDWGVWMDSSNGRKVMGHFDVRCHLLLSTVVWLIHNPFNIPDVFPFFLHLHCIGGFGFKFAQHVCHGYTCRSLLAIWPYVPRLRLCRFVAGAYAEATYYDDKS